MNKLYILILFILVSAGLKAQPTFSISNINANPGDLACVDFSVSNFVDIVSYQYTVTWDPTVLQFNSVTNLGLPDLAQANFGPSMAASGILLSQWFDLSVVGVTLPDNSIIYSVCFDVIGSIGNASPISIAGAPMSIEVITSDFGAGDIGIDPVSGGGNVTVGDPLQVCAPVTTSSVGSNICIPVTSANFIDINGFQYSMHYDPAILNYVSVTNFHPNLNNITANGVGGDIAISWFESLGNGITISPTTTLFDVCFDVVGNAGDVSPITFDGSPTIIEVTSSQSGGTNIGLQPKNGSITISDPPTDLIMEAVISPMNNTATTVCIDFHATDFEDMVAMQYSINWDPTVLQFVNATDNGLATSAINIGSVNAVTNGEATVSWFGPGSAVTIPDDSNIFTFCFERIGNGGDCTDITFSGTPLFEEVFKNNGGGNEDVNLIDTPVEVCLEPDPFVLADTTIFHIDCNNTFGTIDVEYAGGVPPYTATWSHGPITFDVTNLAAGFYTTTVMDSNGSSFMHTFEVIDYILLDPGCDDGLCANGVETWDGCDCVDGADPVACTDDGECSNGEEFWNEMTCLCEQINIPDETTCVDDGVCENGFEMWNSSTCNCDVIPAMIGCMDPMSPNFDSTANCPDPDACECPDPGTCSDGICENGEEFWDATICMCVDGADPVACTDDGECSNGEEFWNEMTCLCEQINIPDETTCVDDGVCENGFEMWNSSTCNCDVIPAMIGCMDPMSPNFDSTANCPDPDACECPDPGTCSDGICENGEEFWDATICMCVDGPEPVACTDDGECSNGEEFWNAMTCLCEQINIPNENTCIDDLNCENGVETWNEDTCECEQLNEPDASTCMDDGVCENGFEMWNPSTCNCDVIPAMIGCMDPMSPNFDATANCPDPAACICPDPGTCDDGICENGEEFWDASTCMCADGPEPVACTDDGECSNGEEFWNAMTCLCEQINIPNENTCIDDLNCENGVETWNEDTCECEQLNEPDASTCMDDGVCENGFEMWNPSTCNCDVIPAMIGCMDPMSPNFDATANCPDPAACICPDPGTCDDGICENGEEFWDASTCMCADGPEPVACTDDGECSNGEEFWNAMTCLCEQINIPNENTCIDDLNCENGVETWNEDTCECEQLNEPDASTCMDDGVCENGFEMWNPSTCNCDVMPAVIGCMDPMSPNFDATANCPDDDACICPDPGTCSDNNCENGEEVWDASICMCVDGPEPVPCTDDDECSNGEEVWDAATCTCEQINIPNPATCVDDGDCTNGNEIWNFVTCNCDVISTIVGCMDPMSPNFNPDATCSDPAACLCSDPGTCDDNICENGVETWNAATCMCVDGDTPEPCTDDGECSNGEEFWNTTTCLCEQINIPEPATCVDDGNCENGFETWNEMTCNCDVVQAIFGCVDPTSPNFNPDANCADEAACECTDPGNCDDNNCTNGIEAWDPNLCECVIAQSVNLITPDVNSEFSLCQDDDAPEISINNPTTGYDVNWYNTDLVLIFIGNDFSPTMPGVYYVALEELVSSCESEMIEIFVAEVVPPFAVAGIGGELNCLIPELTLNAAGSDTGVGFTANWTTTNGLIESGSNTLTPTVTSAGDYLLTITDTLTMCTAEDVVTITSNLSTPSAITEVSENIGCLLSITLDATSSSVGPEYIYQWTTTDGNILNGATTLTPEINTAGVYELVVTNTESFCTNSISVTVMGTPPESEADAGFDDILCGENRATLDGFLPSGVTGYWTAINSNPIFSDINDPNAAISNLAAGENILTWTISNSNCADYDQDTIVISVQWLPTTNDDYFEMDSGDLHENFNVGLNDNYDGIDNWTFNFLTNPAEGMVTFPGGGIISFDIPENVFGEQQFTYEVCNDLCLSHCDSASVIINVLPPEVVIDSTSYFPNTITPNGDGANDFFILELLEQDPGRYPNNELVIFNRWGDVVYKASPYLNNWNGVNKQGFDLPQGTYFYVVRLDIAEGEILRGDITILK